MASAAWEEEEEEEEEWELCNDDGFVYKRKKRRHDSTVDVAVAAAAPPATDPEEEQRQLVERRKRTLLKLKNQYQREIDQWEHMSNTLQARMEVRTTQAQQPSSSSSSHPSTSSSSSMESAQLQPPSESNSKYHQFIDDLLLQAEAQEAILEDLSNLCDTAETFCKAEEERLKQPFFDLPVWATTPRALMASLSAPDD